MRLARLVFGARSEHGKGPELPPVMATQNTYFLWGLALLEERAVEGGIAVGSGAEDLARIYARVEDVGVHRCEHCMPWRSALSLRFVWDPRVPLVDVWPQLKHYE